MYKPSRKMPRSGQFIAVWTHRGKIWCENFKWVGGKVMSYEEESDDFTYAKTIDFNHDDIKHVVYCKYKEE